MHQTEPRPSKRIFVALMMAAAVLTPTTATAAATITGLDNPSAAVFRPTAAVPQDDTPWP